MKRFLVLSLALALAPVATLAQAAPPPAPAAGMDGPAPSAQQMAAMQQMHAQMEQSRLLVRSRMLATLTPQHRTMVATVVGQLALSANPNPRAAAQSLDAVLLPAEKQSIVNIEAAERTNMHALMEQHRAAFEASMTADQRAELEQRKAKMDAFRQSHPRPAHVADPGEIVLRTLGTFGDSEMHGHHAF